MSRIARKPLIIPDDVQVSIENNTIKVKGKYGENQLTVHPLIELKLENNSLSVLKKNDSTFAKALQGTFYRLINNLIIGVREKFSKKLQIIGVGYRAQLQGKKLSLQVGFCKPVEMPIPEGINVELPSPTEIVISGVDKQKVGQFAAVVRRIRPPEPYKGKGIRYADEVVRKKAGKSFASGG